MRVHKTQVSGTFPPLVEFGSSSGEKNAPLEPSEKTAHPQKVFLRKTLSQKIAFYSCRIKRAPFILASKVPAKRYLISQLMAKLYQKDLSGPSNLRQVPIKISAA